MTTDLVTEIAKRVNQIDSRISAYAEGGCIKGTFRGKQKEDYCFLVSAKEFKYNNEGPNVRKAVEQAISELLTVKEVKKMTKSEIMKLAHSFKKEGLTMSQALTKAWSIAKGN